MLMANPPGAAPVPATPSRPVESRDPATGEVWRRYAAPSTAEVAATVAAARQAQPAWAGLAVRERARVLDRFRSVLMARRIEVATAICRENGKPVGEALATEILVALDYAAYFARLAPKALAPRSVAPAT